MAKLKFLESLTASAADKAEARTAKLSAQFAEVSTDLAAAEACRAAERKALAEALGNGQDATRAETALAEVVSTIARLSERRHVLAELVEKARAEAGEARRTSTLDKAREAFEEARAEAEDAKGKAVAAFIEAQKVAGLFAEAVTRCDGAAASVRALDPEADPASGPWLGSLFFEVSREAEAQGLRPLASQPATFAFYA